MGRRDCLDTEREIVDKAATLETQNMAMGQLRMDLKEKRLNLMAHQDLKHQPSPDLKLEPRSNPKPYYTRMLSMASEKSTEEDSRTQPNPSVP